MDLNLEKTNPSPLEGYIVPQEVRTKLPVIYDAIGVGVPMRGACAMAGVPYDDFRWIIENVPEIRVEISKAHAELTRRHLENIAFRAAPKTVQLRRLMKGKNGEIFADITQDSYIPADWRASAWILERTSRDEFAPTVTTNVNVNGNLDITGMMRTAIARVTEKGATIVGIQEAEFTEIEDDADLDEQKE